MTALDPDNTAQEAPAPPVVGPMAGDPAMLGLGSFIVGSVALGLAIVGVVPAGVLGAPPRRAPAARGSPSASP